jgi:hypothetical protein
VAAAAAVAVAAALAARARALLALRLWERMPVALLGPHSAATRATLDALSRDTYLALAPRGAALAAGVLAALAAGSPRCTAAVARRALCCAALRLVKGGGRCLRVCWLHACAAEAGPRAPCRRPGWLLTAAAVPAALVAAGLRESRFGPLPDPGHKFADPALLALGFVALPGALQPAAAAALLLALARGPPAGACAQLRGALGGAALARLADLSYGVFLLHPLVRPARGCGGAAPTAHAWRPAQGLLSRTES